jgi:germination protein M
MRGDSDMLKSRKPLVLLTALAMMFVTAAPGVSAQELPPGGTFVDDDGNAHEANIEALVAAGITQGCAVDRFCPEDPVTRGQMASFIVRSVEDLAPATRDWFPDDTGSVHEADINIIAENGITIGYTDGRFGPLDPVTRGQMASFLARALDDLAPATKDWFPDDAGSVHEADINIIAENGITIGYTDGTFRPNTPISRAEMATLLVRALGLTPIQPPPRTVEFAAYFLMDSLGDDPIGPGPFLVPVAREISTPAAPGTPTMAWLLEGPSQAERDGLPSLSTAIPVGTQLRGLVVANGVATVDLSSEFASGGGSFSMLARVAQVVFTLTQFPTVDEVSFEIEGVPVDVLGGEGLMLDAYGTREGFLGAGLLPLIFVDRPAWGGDASNPMRIVGRTAAFEAEFTATIVDADGLILIEQNVLAQGEQVIAPGGPRWSSFDVTIPYTVDQPQIGALIVWATSAVDGSQIAVREYPVLLIPAG